MSTHMPDPRSSARGTPSGRSLSIASHLLRQLTVWLALCFMTMISLGQEEPRPLKPPDRSSPRATLKTFLEAGDAVGAFLIANYENSPSREGYYHLNSLVRTAVKCLDLYEMAPAARYKAGRAAALALYETLCRIELPPLGEIPDASRFEATFGTNAVRWVIPNTQIVLERMPNGPQQGQFLFSAQTVAEAEDFYERVRGLDYTRPVPAKNLPEIGTIGGGWLIPYSWVKAWPPWLRTSLGGQALWKWIALFLALSFFVLFLRVAYRVSRRGTSERPCAITTEVIPVEKPTSANTTKSSGIGNVPIVANSTRHAKHVPAPINTGTL